MSYTHFTLEERKYLQQLLSDGLSMRKIAAILERSPSSISREIKRNRTKGKPKKEVDRKSRFLRLALLDSRNATETRIAIESSLAGLPVKSISLDNGAEFSEFHQLEQNLNTLVYFAEPHKPWQRGTNENTNDLVRFFFLKGFDFRTITAEELQKVEDLINNHPRKCLGWRTPAEVFFQEKSVAFD